MSTHRLIPAVLAGLVDDAAVFPPGCAELPEAVAAHREHRAAWYADLVGPLLLPASALLAGPMPATLREAEPLAAGIVGDTGLADLAAAVAAPPPGLRVRQVEYAVAKRGQDPQPGLDRFVDRLAGWPGLAGYAEIPLTWGLSRALDTVAAARAGGLPVAGKFRTGGLAAELFPTPVELAAVICGCRDRHIPYKLTAGLHHAVRQADPETGFVHHGFLNVLAADVLADRGGEVADVAEALAATDAVPLVELSRARRDAGRPLWRGFGSCSVREPLTDLVRLGLINGGYEINGGYQ
ncbi:MAG TPA: hypothetical protein VES42_13100 [Pilimelia sp.]|nr:hypothetical protein [Pilimelia sp.]